MVVSSAWRVYFIVSSKEGSASISVDHPAGAQSLLLPVAPMNAVPEALPLLEPAFAHYVAQWKKIMVPDVDETDARGFFLEATDVPGRIADPAAGEALMDISWRNMPPEWRRFFGRPMPSLMLRDDIAPPSSNADEICEAALEAGIEPYRSA